MASIRDLRLPDCEQVSTVHNHDIQSAENVKSMSTHAIAYHSKVHGTNPISNPKYDLNAEQDRDENDWIKWTRDLKKHVCQVVSTTDGGIIAASTVDGLVSILRGVDGGVLMTQSITSNSDRTGHGHGIAFVQNSGHFGSKDTLVIYELNKLKNEHDVLLVSGIDGQGLNSFDLEVVRASSRFSINSTKLKFHDGEDGYQRSALTNVNCSFVSKTEIRFVVATQDGTLSVHDYNISTKKILLVKESLKFGGTSRTSCDLKSQRISTNNGDSILDDGSERCQEKWVFQAQSGIQFDLNNKNGFGQYILVAARRECKMKICWFNLYTMEYAGGYVLKAPINGDTVSEISAICPLIPCLEKTVAVAVASNLVAVRDSNVIILQGVVDEPTRIVDDMSMCADCTICRLHEVHRVGVHSSTSALVGCLNNGGSSEFCIRFKVKSQSSVAIKEFRSGQKNIIARARLFLAKDEIDKADDVISIASKEDLSSPFGSIHNSEIALIRFKKMLLNERILTSVSKDQVKECLRRLSSGAVSSGSEGVESLLKASQALHNWSSPNCPYIRDYRMTLHAMAMSIANAIKGVSPKYIAILEEEGRVLESKASMLKSVETVLEYGKLTVQDKEQMNGLHKTARNKLSSPLLEAKNHIELYNLLISQGAFKVAESVRNSGEEGAKAITPEIVAESITKITSKFDPGLYCAWLQNAVFPGLKITHHVLDKIFAWGCEMADAFDRDESYGIDASILLLETLKKAVAKLAVDNHASFAHFSPFDVKPDLKNIPTQIDVNLSVDSHNSSSSSRFRDQSLLNSAVKVNENNLDLDQSLLLEEAQSSFKTKLMQAKIIKAAREIGLAADVLRLASFVSLGGSALAAKELVRLLFTNDSNNCQSGDTDVKEKLEQFCALAAVSFDNSIEEYSKELCSNALSDPTSLTKATALVGTCLNPDVKCRITLRFLRTAQLSPCTPPCLNTLAEEAIHWATNEELRSELEEATRLLGIDDILRRYCGNKSAELFRVSDPVHSARFAEYVTRKINAPNVLSDILYLCNAFTHLSALDHCSALIQRQLSELPCPPLVADQELEHQCAITLHNLFKIDGRLAENVAIRVSEFCIDAMQSPNMIKLIGRDESNHRHELLCAAVISISRTAAKMSPKGPLLKFHKFLLRKISSNPWAELMREFQRMYDLIREFSISISLSELRGGERRDSLMNAIVRKVVDQSEICAENSGEKLELNLTKARRGCGLLFGSDNPHVMTSMWCKAVGSIASELVRSGDQESCMILLEASGLLDEIRNAAACEAIISVCLTLCLKASDTTALISEVDDSKHEMSMKSIIVANSLLQEHALVFCPGHLLPLMIFLSNLVDVTSQIILKSDCGIGEKMDAYKQNLFEKSRSRRRPLARSIIHSLKDENNEQYCTVNLHPSWHTSDGLLLPPMQALSECMAYCKGLLNVISGSRSPDLLHVHHFLHERGAHSISLRMLACASVVISCNRDVSLDKELHQEQAGIFQKIFLHLAERGLGGSGSGNTNSKIDYQLSVPILLNLHMKVAFKAYKVCIPSALSGRDFDKIIALANIGRRAAGSSSCYEDEASPWINGWKNQENFVLQCQTLTGQSFWWNVLQRFGVKFDPRAFEDSGEEKDGEEYIISLVPQLVHCASKAIAEASIVTQLVSDFCKAFDLDPNLALQKHIEFLLSWPKEACDETANLTTVDHIDIRRDLAMCAVAVDTLLKKLPNAISRSLTLRQCLVNLERIEESGKDFERYTMILYRYQIELRTMISLQSKPNSVQSISLHQEIERIDRRQDALAILSSFFNERKIAERPCFQKCFQPLPAVLGIEKGDSKTQVIGVLGHQGSYSIHYFDPLSPLRGCLQSSPSQSAASALDPMCVALGLPSGYIHARALVERMIAAKSSGGSQPPFETEVLPVIKRLKISNDGAEFAEFCATQYDVHSNERLLCLNVALELAIKASTEAEQILLTTQRKNREGLIENERKSLDRVERLTSAKSALSDIMTVKTVLDNAMTKVEDSTITHIISDILEEARSKTKEENNWNISPEQFAENLLVEGSLAAVEASLDIDKCLDSTGLCLIASAVHKACSALEDHYSHINVGHISRNLVRSWLIHGDEGTGSFLVDITNQQIFDAGTEVDNQLMDYSLDEDETVNFVLDLNTATGKTAWTDDVGCHEPKLKRLKTMTADEEQSSLKATTSRETSEYLSTRAGLRVAFVMSFAKDFHLLGTYDQSLDDEGKNPSQEQNTMMTLDNSDHARKHANYLLNLVFSKSGFGKSKFDGGQSVRSGEVCASTRTRKVSTPGNKAYTFGMRHRALRAACALCPEEIMKTVIAEQGFIRSENCALSQCCFGSFVAKEIEEMGLPLPHSDLVQLSIMHHPSYARTLWRHHGRSANGGHRGRLMLLMLELVLREGKVIDPELVTSILSEVLNLNLPRTNLLICECVSQIERIHDIFTVRDRKVAAMVLKITKQLTTSILHDISIQDESTSNQRSSIMTIHRLGRVITSFMKRGISHTEVKALIDSMIKVASQCKPVGVRAAVFEVAATIVNEIKDGTQSEILQKLCSSVDNAAVKSKIATIVGASSFEYHACFDARTLAQSSAKKDSLVKLLKIEAVMNKSVSRVIYSDVVNFEGRK